MKIKHLFMVATAAFLIAACKNQESNSSKSAAVLEKLKIDETKWLYSEKGGVYYQIGLQYAENPADSSYQNMGIFVPEQYFSAKDNGDGTFTAKINEDGKKGNWSAKNAPWVIPVETPGYAALKPPADYADGVKPFTDAGFVFLFAGCRGRDSGAPSGVVDLKAAIRYARHNSSILPGNGEKLFCYGMSGGGAQSAILGASGDSPLYAPYLEKIGAANESDAVFGAMCWCPITNLDIANSAYEWNMGLAREYAEESAQNNMPLSEMTFNFPSISADSKSSEKEMLQNAILPFVSARLAKSFASYINEIALKDENGQTLVLEETADGYFQAGSYYDFIKKIAEDSLNSFLKNTTFPFDASKQEEHMAMLSPSFVPRGPQQNGEHTNFEQIDNVRRIAGGGGIKIEGVYNTAEEYIAALNVKSEWVKYENGEAKITSLADFARFCKRPTKTVGAFDSLDKNQGENELFSFGNGTNAHFDKYLLEILRGTDFEDDFQKDISSTDSLNTSMKTRSDMYNPMYYLTDFYGGKGSSKIAKNWRIHSGIFQGDTAICTEANLALALRAILPKNAVEFEAVWGKYHVEAESSGSAEQNFIDWVNSCE